MKLFAVVVGLLTMIAPVFAQSAAQPDRDVVVLLHGLGRTKLSMLPLACALERQGFRVVNLTYPSRLLSLDELATEWLPARLRDITPRAGSADPSAPRLHFVTHSMGGILVRLWLRECGAPARLGRVVMIAPPNAGSEVADRLARFRSFHWATGKNGARLRTARDALPHALGRWPLARNDLGVIAGDASIDPLLGLWLPQPHDGKVTVASTHLAGERDHRLLPFSHPWLPCRRLTHAHVIAFLRDGKFGS